MKVLQTIAGLSAKSGGPSTCVRDMMDGLCGIGAHTDLLTVSCAPDKNIAEGRSWLKEVENDYATPFVISHNAQRYLYQNNYDVYHCNALWMGINHDTCSIARKKGKPYVISPHGMLYPTALKVHRWKKWILLHLWYNKDIMNASCIHATCKQEAEFCRQFGYKGPIAIIPNAVVIPQGLTSKSDDWNSIVNGRRQIGFLGRLDPIKKVENIIYALSLLSKDEQNKLSLQVMGKYDDEYESFLKSEVARLNLNDCVDFVGFVSGKEKYERLSRLSALMVPSTQENFGMIVPEALICGTPVYASLGTPWEELNECQCGWWKDNNPETITTVMREILTLSDSELIAMGKRGRLLIEDKYELHKAADMMNRLYQWIFKCGEKPEFLYGK